MYAHTVFKNTTYAKKIISITLDWIHKIPGNEFLTLTTLSLTEIQSFQLLWMHLTFDLLAIEFIDATGKS